MNRYPTRYALLRDRRAWPDCVVEGLEADADGRLSRRRIPGLLGAAAIDLPGPYLSPPSGLAARDGGILAVADTEHDRVHLFDGLCKSEYVLPSQGGMPAGLGALSSPAGLSILGDQLWIADVGHDRLVCFSIAVREVVATIDGLANPTSIAIDASGRLHAIESGAPAIRRFQPWLDPDSAFDAQVQSEIAAPGRLPGTFAPLFLALAPDGTLLVSEGSSQSILRFDGDGLWLPPFAVPAVTPGALAVGQNVVYVADTTSGAIAMLDPTDGTLIGTVAGWRAPVSALAIDGDVNLLVKAGLDASFHRLDLLAARLPSGSVRCGPIDAGQDQEWWRALVAADESGGGAVVLDVWQTDDPTVVPGAADWRRAPAASTLLAGLGDPASTSRRHLWLRATLSGATDQAGPVLDQVRAETPGEDYLDYLPAIYRKTDTPAGFLARLLAHTQDQLLGLEDRIDDISLLFTEDFAPTDALDWLAGWMAFDLPLSLSLAERRRLIARIVALQDRRGTPASLAGLIELYTGVQPQIREAFRDRRIWLLDAAEGSRLGFDTGLPAAEPEGIVVPDDPQPNEAAFPGCAPTIGSFVPGESQPLAGTMWGSGLYADTAHLFSVTVPADLKCQPAVVEALLALLDREKPAHTEYVLCALPTALRAGYARVGIETIVAAPAETSLDGAMLDSQFILGGSAERESRFRPPPSPAAHKAANQGA